MEQTETTDESSRRSSSGRLDRIWYSGRRSVRHRGKAMIEAWNGLKRDAHRCEYVAASVGWKRDEGHQNWERSGPSPTHTGKKAAAPEAHKEVEEEEDEHLFHYRMGRELWIQRSITAVVPTPRKRRTEDRHLCRAGKENSKDSQK